MAPGGGNTSVLNADISFEMERLFDHYNFDHVPVEERLGRFKQRDLASVKRYKAAVKIFGGPSSRTRIIVAPPMETPLKHRLGYYVNVFKPPPAPVLNGSLRPHPDKAKLPSEEETAHKEEAEHLAYYKSWIMKRKQLREDLDNLNLLENYLERKMDKSELEKRVQTRYKADRPWAIKNASSPEAAPPQKLPDVPVISIPPLDGLQVLDKFLSLNHMRLMDLFLSADKDKNWTLSRHEFLKAVKQAEIPLTESEVDAIIITLDDNLDDELTYQDLNQGLQLWRKQRRDIKQQNEKEAERSQTKLESTQKEKAYRTMLKEQTHDTSILVSARKECFEEDAHFKQNTELMIETRPPSLKVNKEKSTTSEKLQSSSRLTSGHMTRRPHLMPEYGGKISESEKKLDELLEPEEMVDMVMSKKGSRLSWSTSSEESSPDSVRADLFSPASETKICAANIASPNTTETFFPDDHDGRFLYKDKAQRSEEILPPTAAAEDSEEEDEKNHTATLGQMGASIREGSSGSQKPSAHSRASSSGSQKASAHSRASTSDSLELPEPDLRGEARMPTSAEEMLDIRKHDRFVLSRSKMRRSLPVEDRKAFDKLPAVIKVGYKPIDDHCSESTLGGDLADMVNQFRREKLREYFEVKKHFEHVGLPFTQNTLDKVLLYPGDKPSYELQRKLILPKSTSNREHNIVNKVITSEGRKRWQSGISQSEQQGWSSSRSDGAGRGSLTGGGGGKRTQKSKGIFHKNVYRSGRKQSNHGHLTVEDVYPFASTVTPKVYHENLSSGKARVSRRVDSWMSFEEYSKYTQNLPNRFRHFNNKSNPAAFWPGHLLNKLRLYMDSDLAVVDGCGPSLENRDSRAYDGFGTGMYNGRGNALFHHTAQPKRAYPGYNNDLLTWPVGENGVRYGNIDEHRLVK